MAQLNTIPFLAGVAKAVAARFSFLHRPSETPAQSVLRSKLDTRKWSPELLKQLEWRRFEELCAAYYEALGFTTSVNETGTPGGVDIVLHAQGSERLRCHEARVGPSA